VSRESEAEDFDSHDVDSDDTLPTWPDLFARGEAVGASEADVRESLRSRRDA
jgi:hypothetical protein